MLQQPAAKRAVAAEWKTDRRSGRFSGPVRCASFSDLAQARYSVVSEGTVRQAMVQTLITLRPNRHELWEFLENPSGKQRTLVVMLSQIKAPLDRESSVVESFRGHVEEFATDTLRLNLQYAFVLRSELDGAFSVSQPWMKPAVCTLPFRITRSSRLDPRGQIHTSGDVHAQTNLSIRMVKRSMN